MVSSTFASKGEIVSIVHISIVLPELRAQTIRARTRHSSAVLLCLLKLSDSSRLVELDASVVVCVDHRPSYLRNIASLVLSWPRKPIIFIYL